MAWRRRRAAGRGQPPANRGAAGASHQLTTMFKAVLVLLSATATTCSPAEAAPQLEVKLNPSTSIFPYSVAEVDQSSVPAAATWFKLVAASSNEYWPCGSAGGGVPIPKQLSLCWFPRTPPKDRGHFQEGPLGIQQLPFGALDAAAPASNFTLVVQAWSDRNDLGDGVNATLLATSDQVSLITARSLPCRSSHALLLCVVC